MASLTGGAVPVAPVVEPTMEQTQRQGQEAAWRFLYLLLCRFVITARLAAAAEEAVAAGGAALAILT